MSTKPSVACLLLALAATLPAHAENLIQNGGFEADSVLVQSPDAITAWSAREGGLIGSVAVLSGTTSPGSGQATAGAFSGQNYALLDLSQPAYSVLYQSFTVAAGGVGSASLSYSLFASSFASAAPPASTPVGSLDYAGSDALLTVRVDVLNPGADALSVAPSDLLGSYFPTVDFLAAGGQPSAYVNYSHALDASQLLAGQTYTLRFALAGNTAQALVGIDAVALDVSPVPEPGAWALMLAGLAGMGFVARRRN